MVQAVAQLLPLLQGGHGQAQMLLQVLNLSLAPAFHAAQLLLDFCVSFACQVFLLQIREWQTCLIKTLEPQIILGLHLLNVARV